MFLPKVDIEMMMLLDYTSEATCTDRLCGAVAYGKDSRLLALWLAFAVRR